MRWSVCVPAIMAVFALTATAGAAELPEKWVFGGANFNDSKEVDKFIALMREAKSLGCNGMRVYEPQFGFIYDMPSGYLENIERTRKAAAEIGIEIIPTVFSIGYSGGYLVQDPNLAAGIPVRGAPFIVKGAAATPEASSAPALANPGFDTATKDGPVGWEIFKPAGNYMDLDKNVKHSGEASLVLYKLNELPKEAKQNCFITQKIKVKPFQYYHLSIWTKTKDLRAEEPQVLLQSSGGKRTHCYTKMDIAPNADWTQHDVTFNTLEASEITVSVGVWNAQSGTIWWDDIEIEPAGLAKVLRRELVPLKVTNADGSVTYEEGKDFEPVADPQLGKDVFADKYYKHFPNYAWHKGPAIKLTPGSRIKDGDKLLVSFFHTQEIYADQVLCSIEDPKILALMDRQMKAMAQAWKASDYFMNYDEIRIGGWENQPGGTKMKPGALLAKHVAKGIEIVKKYAPDAKIYVWSDMFDPTHNAHKLDGPGYYLVNGSWDGAWDGLPKDVIIMNWNGTEHAAESLRWFAGRGHKQIIAGYYDGDPKENLNMWLKASDGVPNVIGMMYTTWVPKYGDLPAFFKALAAWRPSGR